MDQSRLPASAYGMLLALDKAGKHSWVTDIKTLLNKYGFGYVFISQCVENEAIFMQQFELRVRDCAIQEWKESIEQNKRLQFYSIFKDNNNVEPYLTHVNQYKFKSALARIRCSSHCLQIEMGRRTRLDLNDRVCQFCFNTGSNIIESESHFLLECPLYDELRQKYIPSYYWKFPNTVKLCNLMKSKNASVLNDLAKYIFFSEKKRLVYLRGR